VFGVLAQVTIRRQPRAVNTWKWCVPRIRGAEPWSTNHPEQEETFHVLEGTMEVLRDGAWISVQAGQTHLVRKGEVHVLRSSFLSTWRPWTG
jgi:mannose-6-phosphate isomerase-like protein (cupin superfamily)